MENQEIRISRLHPDRWQDYKALRLEALQKDPKAFGATYEKSLERPDDYWKAHLITAQTDPNKVILFAQEGENIVGMGGSYPEEDPKNVNIVGMYVQPAHRGRGLGRKILEAIVREVQAEIRLCVNDSEQHAVRLYKDFGFTTLAETPKTHADGSQYTELYMALTKER